MGIRDANSSSPNKRRTTRKTSQNGTTAIDDNFANGYSVNGENRTEDNSQSHNIHNHRNQSIWPAIGEFTSTFFVGIYPVTALLIFSANLFVMPFIEYQTKLGFIGYVIKGVFTGIVGGLGWPVFLITEWTKAINDMYFLLPLAAGMIISSFIAYYNTSSLFQTKKHIPTLMVASLILLSILFIFHDRLFLFSTTTSYSSPPNRIEHKRSFNQSRENNFPALENKDYISPVHKDGTIHFTGSMYLHSKIFGYEKPDIYSRKMILISFFTKDVEGNPCGCKYGAYYDTSHMQIAHMKVKYINAIGNFIKVAILKNKHVLGSVYMEKKWFGTIANNIQAYQKTQKVQSSRPNNNQNIVQNILTKTILRWNDAINTRNYSFMHNHIYSDYITYYGKYVSREYVIKDKRKALEKYANFKQRLVSYSSQKIHDNTYVVTFDKYVKQNIAESEKKYPAYLHIRISEGSGIVINEGDKITDKSINTRRKYIFYKVVNVRLGSSLNIRSKPGTNYAVVGKLRYDAKRIKVSYCKKYWCKIDSSVNNQAGWVWRNNLQKE